MKIFGADVTFEWPTFAISWGGPERDWWFWQVLFWEPRREWTYKTRAYRNRRWGFERDWYDGPFVQLCLGCVTVSWSTYWTIPEASSRSSECTSRPIEEIFPFLNSSIGKE
jgi:hypothetical protein